MTELNVDPDAFPNNLVSIIGARIKAIDEDLTVPLRPLKSTDPNLSVGVFATEWIPNEQSMEMGGIQASTPTLGTYYLGIQTLVKSPDSSLGLFASGNIIKSVRMMLYRDPILRGQLSGLEVIDPFGRELLQRWGSQRTGYISNELDGTFISVSSMDLFFETEMR